MPVKLLWGAVVLVLCQPVFAADVVKGGAWKTIDYEVQGMWSIVDTGDGLAVELGEDFETKNGPDLHILLSPKSVNMTFTPAIYSANRHSKTVVCTNY